ncbi:heterokaryon incompatibility protein-domain-containing protein, partial [Lasiosphaeria hispida]
MAPGNLHQDRSGRCEEESESGPPGSRSQYVPDNTSTLPIVGTLACGASSQTIADLPRQPRPTAISSRGADKRTSSAPPTLFNASAYRFSPLPDGSIRLLRLMPHRDEHAPIQCQLFEYPLLDLGKGTDLYEALSYVWGPPGKPRLVFTDEGYLLVRDNLYAALSRLRDRSLPRIVWADAICIDQDSNNERNHQVQFMAKIYARASRVVVWLEEATENGSTDGDQALKEISFAAESHSTGSPDGKSQEEVLKLLQRSWFRRIWVLQEVAAARHVLIMCRSTEIEGYAFWEGLDALGLTATDPDTQSRICSAGYLIKGAILRPKYATGRSGRSGRSDRFSLGIRPLGELIDMYHNREATDRRDKVYALLGMGSNIPANLSPNYDTPWRDLFHQLIESFVGEQAIVETWDNKEIAVIKSKGCILGTVSPVPSGSAWDDQQEVNVALKDIPGYLRGWTPRWTLQASAKTIRADDIICFLQGASKPMIVRLYEDYCAVIAIEVTPNGKQTKGLDVNWADLLQSAATSSRDFLFIWDWENSLGSPEDGVDSKYFANSQMPNYATAKLGNPLDKAARLEKIGLLLSDLGKYQRAIKK